MTVTTASRKALQQDITDTLRRLRDYRDTGNRNQIRVAQNRLDWLLDRLAEGDRCGAS